MLILASDKNAIFEKQTPVGWMARRYIVCKLTVPRQGFSSREFKAGKVRFGLVRLTFVDAALVSVVSEAHGGLINIERVARSGSLVQPLPLFECTDDASGCLIGINWSFLSQ
jgi:hypothetical protein